MHVESRLKPLNSIESNVYRFIFIGFSENNAVVLLFLEPKTSSKKTHSWFNLFQARVYEYYEVACNLEFSRNDERLET